MLRRPSEWKRQVAAFVLIIAALLGIGWQYSRFVMARLKSAKTNPASAQHLSLKNGGNANEKPASAMPNSGNGSSPGSVQKPGTPSEDVDKANRNGMTPLMRACQAGSVAEVKRLIALGANVNAAGKRGGTPLLYALGHHPTHEVMNVLLNAGADPTKRDHEGNWPLCLEISEDNGDMESIKLLLDHEKDPPKAATDALYCLEGIHNYYQGPSKAEYLLSRGANANYRYPPHGNTPFIVHSARYGDHRVLTILVQKGHADVNAASDSGETALMAAVQTNNNLNVKTLLDLGADCNLRNKDGLRALDLARAGKPIAGLGYEEEARLDIIHLLSGCTATSK